MDWWFPEMDESKPSDDIFLAAIKNNMENYVCVVYLLFYNVDNWIMWIIMWDTPWIVIYWYIDTIRNFI